VGPSTATSVLRRRYTILDTYRGGGPVEVYKAARIEQANSVCALTVISLEDREGLAVLPGVFDRLGRADHEHLPRVYEHGWLTGARFVPAHGSTVPAGDARFYYAREWIEGSALRNLMDNRDASVGPLGAALDVVEAVGEAVRELHADGLLHLDLAPASVLLPASGGPLRLIGLDSCWPQGEPLPGMGNRGAPGYTAPELYTEGSEGYQVAPATDVFSLAVLLYELVAGRPPFGTGLEYLAYWRELTRRAEPFRLPMQFEGSWGDGLLAAHLRWCLQGMPGRRPQTMDEFLGPIRLLKQALGKPPWVHG